MPKPFDLDESTRRPRVDLIAEPARPRLRLTIALHPALRRVGESVEFVADPGASGLLLSRRAPEFLRVDGRAGGPLGDSFISRAPIALRPYDGGLLVERGESTSSVRVLGAPDGARSFLDAAALAYGAVLTLADRVVLLLQQCPQADEPAAGFGLVGESPAIRAVRRQIARCAGLRAPVLIRGESGTGKELVARAIHGASPRVGGPYVSINMAALNPQTAIAELFGHVRGSFTGAVQSRDGYFKAADGGTIFLDEIGAAPIDVQAMLLRVLETGEIQPVGGAPARRVDVRVVAATDADLAQAIRAGGFRAALYHRLAAAELTVPPLRARRDDIARLLVHFLEHELRDMGRPELFERLAEDASGRLSSAWMLQLLAYAWPGNVRELRNVAGRVAAALLSGDEVGGVVLGPGDDEPGPDADRTPSTGVAPAQRSDEELMAALEEHGWQVASAARTLGIARNTLYARIRRSELLRTAQELPRDVLAAAYERHGGELAPLAAELRVSVHALKLRLRALAIIR